jgi:hypothetical protein
MKIKKIIKWGLIIILVWTFLILFNQFYIIDWRIEYSENRVQENIIKNYEGKEDKFEQVIEYIQVLDIKPPVEIEFIKNSRTRSYFNSPAVSDSASYNSAYFDLNYFNIIKGEKNEQMDFELLEDGKARISYADTVIETKNWHWYFEGGRGTPHYEKYLDYIGITEAELEVLRGLIFEINCEAIQIHTRNGFSMRYDGHGLCQYEYYIPAVDSSRFKLMNEVRLSNNIFCGLNRSDIFCGYIIYDK